MRYLSYLYRFTLNFALLVAVYFSLNFVEKYEQRTILAALVMFYAILMCVSAASTIQGTSKNSGLPEFVRVWLSQ